MEKGGTRFTPGAAHIREQCVWAFDTHGFEKGVVLFIESGRTLLESDPTVYGRLEIRGVRYQPIVDATARRAEGERMRIGLDYHQPPARRAAIIPATVFTSIAYGHPYNDGNKRTGFLAGVAIGRGLGFAWKEPLSEWEEMLEDVRLFVEGNESGDSRRIAASAPREVAKWMLAKVFTVPGRGEG